MQTLSEERFEQRRLLDLLLPDSDPRKGFCGIQGLWVLPADHPFNPACQLHDQRYTLARENATFDTDSTFADDEFYKGIRKIAGNDLVLIAEAHTFFWLCNVWAKWRWPGTLEREPMSTIPAIQKLDCATTGLRGVKDALETLANTGVAEEPWLNAMASVLQTQRQLTLFV